MGTDNIFGRMILGFAFASVVAIGAAGCAGSSPSESESGGANQGSADLAGDEAVSRADEWVAAELTYCQSPNHTRDYDSACSAYCERTDNAAWDPYRSDCSGLVSWAWGLPAPGRTTLGFAPFQTDITHAIDGNDLEPGDALNNADHVILFKEWVTPGESARFIEEPGCSSPTPYAHELVSSVQINGSSVYVPAEGMTFTAIHYDGIDGTPSAPPPVVEPYYRAMATDATGHGYWIVGKDGGVFTFGDSQFDGSLGGKTLNAEIVGMASTPDGSGYWLVGADGGIFGFGDAGFHGSMGGSHLNQPVVGMAATPSGNGYWLVAKDGGIFSFGDAPFEGSTGSIVLNQPVVGMAATPSGNGYWLVAKDGGVFSFGDAPFKGSMGGKPLNQPVVGMAATPSGQGYWLVAADGGIFGFGDAGFYGSLGSTKINAPIVGMARTPSGHGYWLVGGDGGIYSFGDAGFYGSRG